MPAFSNEPYICAKDEIALQLLPCEMELVRSEPDIFTGSGQDKLLTLRQEFSRTCYPAASYVAAPLKSVARILL